MFSRNAVAQCEQSLNFIPRMNNLIKKYNYMSKYICLLCFSFHFLLKGQKVPQRQRNLRFLRSLVNYTDKCFPQHNAYATICGQVVPFTTSKNHHLITTIEMLMQWTLTHFHCYRKKHPTLADTGTD